MHHTYIHPYIIHPPPPSSSSSLTTPPASSASYCEGRRTRKYRTYSRCSLLLPARTVSNTPPRRLSSFPGCWLVVALLSVHFLREPRAPVCPLGGVCCFLAETIEAVFCPSRLAYVFSRHSFVCCLVMGCCVAGSRARARAKGGVLWMYMYGLWSYTNIRRTLLSPPLSVCVCE
ncbi:hypothetical protein OH77DRAFT_1014065 [Trametes cingulata]|nr:hypothetical protein OH77DRAFT_1014065 [Trametes cingulata]